MSQTQNQHDYGAHDGQKDQQGKPGEHVRVLRYFIMKANAANAAIAIANNR